MALRRPSSIQLYTTAVVTTGLGLFFLVTASSGSQHVAVGLTNYWLIALGAVLGELLPIKMFRRGGVEEITTSTAFGFALLLVAGIPVAMTGQAIASIIADISSRKPIWKALFNIGQYTISTAAAGFVLHLFLGRTQADLTHLDATAMAAVLSAVVVFFLVNRSSVQIAIALSKRTSVWVSLRQELFFDAAITGSMLGLSPVVVVLTERGDFLVPLVAIPIAAVYQSARMSLTNALLAQDLKTKAEENEYLALHDALTELPNRTLFHDRVQHAIVSARRDQKSVALMIMDLDRFKEVNDALGHHNGDLLLQQIGKRLQGALRESDTIARLGGDEFAVLLPSIDSVSSAMTAAEKLLGALEESFMLQGLSLQVGASIGVAFYPEHGGDADALIQRADVAMYVAKGARSGYELYSSEHDQYSPRRLALVGELRRAIDDRELVLHYHPRARLDDGSIDGVEALLRWHHPRFGMVPPDDFIPLAEHTGLIRPLALFVLDEAIRQCSVWHNEGLAIGVAVNLSAQNLLDQQLPDEIAGILSKWGVSPAWLELEITESTIMADPVRAMSVLSRLNAMGVTLAIDDFGTGYSSLSHLKRMPVDVLKVDKSFVMGMAVDENDAMIVKSTIDLGKNLGLKVIAEGVATRELWSRLQGLGCEVAQGHYLSEPLPADEAGSWLRARVMGEEIRVVL